MTPSPTRWGVREREPETIRRLAKMAGTIYAVVGVDILMLWLVAGHDPGELPHPTPYGICGVIVTAIGASLVVLGFVVSDEVGLRIYPPLAIAAVFVAAVLVPLNLWFIGYPKYAIGVVTYAVILVIAFYVLARWLALLAFATMLAGHAVLHTRSPGVEHPHVELVWMFSLLLAAGYLVGQLTDDLDRARGDEHRAVEELDVLNHDLEDRVGSQVTELERLSRLRRFLSAPVADAVLGTPDESVLGPHRREIAVLFCDLRGFTAFTKDVEPEEVMEVLGAYYEAAGEQITKFEATLGSFEGDGLMAYLNDPNPCDRPGLRVVELGLAIADAVDQLVPAWSFRGYDLSYGIGMALGHATLGIVGYDGRSDYTALGTVVNLGARLCATAGPRELVVDHRIFVQANQDFELVQRDPTVLKGFADPVRNYLVARA